MYAKMNNGAIEFAPKNYVTPSGETIINFDQSVEKMTSNGFFEIVETEMPSDGREYIGRYEERDGVIAKVWEVAPVVEDDMDMTDPNMQEGA